MPLHLVKLCVGIETVEELAGWIAIRKSERRAAGLSNDYGHVTRMVPKRGAELMDGGSLYWVIKGQIQARQRILGIDPFTDEGGVKRCRIVLDDTLVETWRLPKRPFQGWRYLKPEDAPQDKGQAGSDETLPDHIQHALWELGLV